VSEQTTARDADPVPGVAADLDRAFAEVAALRALGEAEDRRHDEARVYDASIRWGALVAGRLHRLALLSGRGALGAPERARYAELEEELRTLGPLLDRLGLPRPPRIDHQHVGQPPESHAPLGVPLAGRGSETRRALR